MISLKRGGVCSGMLGRRPSSMMARLISISLYVPLAKYLGFVAYSSNGMEMDASS